MREAEPLRLGDPRLLGAFRLTGRLGAGDRGVVYLGEAPSGEAVAIRATPGAPASGADMGGTGAAPAVTRRPVAVRPSAVREAAAAQRVDSPWTARVLAADVEADVPYIVSEYVAGPSLEQVVERHGPRTGSSLQRLAAGTIHGLAAVHQAGLVHGDFRPATVVLGTDGPRVVDFALGALTGYEGTADRPAFKAPEQLSGGGVTAAADVFAWAATMVFASCGRPPFGPEQDPATVTRVLRQQPDLGMLAGRLQEIALRCLAKDPRQRPSSADIAGWLQRAGQPLPAVLPRRPSAHRQGAPEMVPVAGPAAERAREPVIVKPAVPTAPAAPAPETKAHDTSGVEVRIRGRSTARRRAASGAARKRAARRNSLIAGVMAGSTAVGLTLVVWTSGIADSALGRSPGRPAGGSPQVQAPRTGPAVEIATAGGYRYRLAAVGGGVDTGAAATMQSSPSPGTSYVYADYVLGNPLDKPVLLDLYTVDVFIKRDLLPKRARGLCMWHNGVPEDMCTPPARPQVTSRLAGDPPTGGTSGDRYMAPGASYVIRVSVDVPLAEDPGPGDLRLYVWKQTYMADALVKEVPFPK